MRGTYGLIGVDLTCTEPRLLEKYMTHARYAAYLQYHAPRRVAAVNETSRTTHGRSQNP